MGDNSTRYYDGSCGGALNTSVSGVLTGNLNPGIRILRGYTVGNNDAETIYGNLTDSETIKIVSHSMGAAYAKEFVIGLLSFAKEHHISHKIEMELDLAPFQPMLQMANPNINNTLTISHWHDGIAGLSFMFGAKNKRTRFGKVGFLPTTEHSIDSFREEIDKYIPFGNKIKGGRIMQWEENGKK